MVKKTCSSGPEPTLHAPVARERTRKAVCLPSIVQQARLTLRLTRGVDRLSTQSIVKRVVVAGVVNQSIANLSRSGEHEELPGVNSPTLALQGQRIIK